MFLLLYLFFFNKEVSSLAGQNIYDVTCYFESDKGEAYNGTVNTTADGTPCKNWRTYNSPFVPYYLDHNYCRNPRTDAFTQPWCYTADGYAYAVCSIDVCVCEYGRFGNKCEQVCHCKKPGCDDKTGNCSSGGCEEEWSGDSCNVCILSRFGEICEQVCHCKYSGCDDVTGECSIKECKEGWKGDSCNECLHRFGQNCERVCHCQHGECDNITGVCYKPGCMKGWTGDSCNYTTECVLRKYDANYNGTVNTTKSNLPCKRWDKTDSIYYRALEENFCRNPSFDTLDYPWCYTESGKPRYEKCAIPICVCPPGFYGENCQSKCHCAIDGCATITGECNNQTAGCKLPWTGRNCATLFSCPDLQISSIGQLTPTIGTGYHINDTVMFGCDVGYALSSPDTMLCIINDSHTGGKWNNSQPVCQDIECSKSSLHLSDNEIINTRTEIFNFGEVVNISCKKGYIGESKLSKCFKINKWTDNRPVCRGFSCPALQITSTSHFVSPTILTGYLINDTVQFICDLGYALSGQSTLICIINDSHTGGKWNTSQPVCEKKSGSHTIPEKRDGIYMSYGSFGGVLTTIVVISAGLYLGACFYHRRRVRKHISVYEDLQFKSVQRQTVNNDDTYVELQ